MKIGKINLRIIRDSLGNKTIEAIVNGHKASSPSGTSKSRYEAKIIETGKSISNFRKMKKQFLRDLTQQKFDELLKKHMKNLGSQATTALSLAFFSKQGEKQKIKNTFPNLLGNVLGGGIHAKKTKMNIQEILVLPKVKTIPQAIKINMKIWEDVGKELKSAELNIESAWSSNITNEEALDIVSRIAKKYRARIGVDFAASHFYRNRKYIYWDRKLTREQQIKYVARLTDEYNFVYIEDPLQQKDFSGFRKLKENLSGALVCGDDLIATNPKRLGMAIRKKSINAVIVKPNQIGNVTDCLKIIRIARKNKIIPVVSHRSGETKDVSICRLAQYTPLAKFGVTGIRKIKLNELARLWHRAENPRMMKFRIF